MFLSVGERYDDLLVVTSENIVFRRCVENTECVTSERRLRVAQIVNDNDRAEYALRGICVLRAKGTFLVVVILDVQGDPFNKIYECPLAPASTLSITGGDCSVFARQPGEEEEWDPHGLLFDEDKSIVLVGDKAYDKIHIFDTDGNFVSRLEQRGGTLSSPSGFAIQPGIFAPLSVVTPPSSAVSGTVTFGSILKVRLSRAACRGIDPLTV